MIRTKQISWVTGAPIRLTGVNINGSSINITSQLSNSLATVGRGGVSVPLQVSTLEGVGLITSQPLNIVQVYTSNTQLRLADVDGNEVYGRLTEASGVYTLSLFSLVNGAETATSLSNVSIDLDINYRFDFTRLPTDFAISVSKTVSNDPRVNAGASVYTQQLTVTGLNTLSALSKTPSTLSNLAIIVNDVPYYSFGGSTAKFTLSNKVVTWNAITAGYSLESSDYVVAHYTTKE